MTRTTNARIAGFTYLFYIAVAFPSMILVGRATSAQGIAAKLAGIAQHATDVRIVVVLTVIFRMARLPGGADETSRQHFTADAGEPTARELPELVERPGAA